MLKALIIAVAFLAAPESDPEPKKGGVGAPCVEQEDCREELTCLPPHQHDHETQHWTCEQECFDNNDCTAPEFDEQLCDGDGICLH